MYGGHISLWWMFFRNFLSFINWLTNPCITATLSPYPHKLNNQLSLSLSLSYTSHFLSSVYAPQWPFHYSFKLHLFYYFLYILYPHSTNTHTHPHIKSTAVSDDIAGVIIMQLLHTPLLQISLEWYGNKRDAFLCLQLIILMYSSSGDVWRT